MELSKELCRMLAKTSLTEVIAGIFAKCVENNNDADEFDIEAFRLVDSAPAFHAALVAIRARLNGEWDNPALQSFGPMTPDARADILEIIRITMEMPPHKERFN